MSGIPIVDFSKFLHGASIERQEVAKAIDSAFQNAGFVHLQNHGVAQARVDDCFAWSKRFFDLPENIKLLAPHPPGGSHHRGYSGLGLEKVSQNVFNEEELEVLRQVPDIKESFESGNVDDESQPNIWLPEDQLPGFQSYMESFFNDCRNLIHQILQALALSLNLPSPTSQLSDAHAQSLFQLRLLHYPAVPRSLFAGVTSTNGQSSSSPSRIAAHSDFGTLTLLFQDAVGGLEIEERSMGRTGSFRMVTPVPGTVLVNIGDLMERWSNGRWKSTVHRVVAPPPPLPPDAALPVESNDGDVDDDDDDGQKICKARYSIPFFATADPDTIIEALPGCWDEDENPKKYESVTAWDYVQMRMAALYN